MTDTPGDTSEQVLVRRDDLLAILDWSDEIAAGLDQAGLIEWVGPGPVTKRLREAATNASTKEEA